MDTVFDLHLPRHIRSGRDSAADAVEAVCARGRRPLLIHGTNPKRSQWLVDALHAADCPPVPFACPSEPDIALIEQGVATGRRTGVDIVIGLGGGSVIDTAKAVAGLIPVRGDVVNHLEVVGDNLPLDAAPLPFVALPTTAGTGAEATYNAVIGVPAARRKVSLRDPRLLPDIAIVDPALTDNTPVPVTLASGLDAITQTVEPFIGCRANRFTDAICRDAIPQGLAALRTLMTDEDALARDTMAWVSLSGGLALANARLGAVHGLAGPLGGVTDMPHGAIAGALLPEALRVNRELTAGQSAGRIIEVEEWIAEALGCDADAAIDRLVAWSREHGLPGLAEAGLDPAELPAIADAAQKSSSMRGNPVVLPTARLVQMMEQAW